MMWNSLYCNYYIALIITCVLLYWFAVNQDDQINYQILQNADILCYLYPINTEALKNILIFAYTTRQAKLIVQFLIFLFYCKYCEYRKDMTCIMILKLFGMNSDWNLYVFSSCNFVLIFSSIEYHHIFASKCYEREAIDGLLRCKARSLKNINPWQDFRNNFLR